jgi:8-oxo-dGTP pyrophosphatase MutT (NUDIX family)
MVKFITAGGGLVQNGFGEFLLIFRDGKWDLPKGKQDEGETLVQTALREVHEECGLDNIVPGPFIAATWHSYWLNNVLVFKQTHWFYMYVEERPRYHPQAEEGIEQCIWCTAEEATSCLSESYPSIRWLFQRAIGKKAPKKLF